MLARFRKPHIHPLAGRRPWRNRLKTKARPRHAILAEVELKLAGRQGGVVANGHLHRQHDARGRHSADQTDRLHREVAPRCRPGAWGAIDEANLAPSVGHLPQHAGCLVSRPPVTITKIAEHPEHRVGCLTSSGKLRRRRYRLTRPSSRL